jgi:hypothetical protein
VDYSKLVAMAVIADSIESIDSILLDYFAATISLKGSLNFQLFNPIFYYFIMYLIISRLIAHFM